MVSKTSVYVNVYKTFKLSCHTNHCVFRSCRKYISQQTLFLLLKVEKQNSTRNLLPQAKNKVLLFIAFEKDLNSIMYLLEFLTGFGFHEYLNNTKRTEKIKFVLYRNNTVYRISHIFDTKLHYTYGIRCNSTFFK